MLDIHTFESDRRVYIQMSNLAYFSYFSTITNFSITFGITSKINKLPSPVGMVQRSDLYCCIYTDLWHGDTCETVVKAEG